MEDAGCDLGILDCPPVHKDISLDAAERSDFVLIPTNADVFDVRSTLLTIELLNHLKKSSAVVLTFCPPAGPEVSDARSTIQTLETKLCPVQIHHRKAYARAQQTGLTAQEFEPNGKAALEITHLYMYTCTQLDMNGDNNHGEK